MLWPAIDAAAKRVGFSASEIAKDLKLRDHATFGRLQPQVVGEWIHKVPGETRRWTDKVLARVAKGFRAGGDPTRVGILVRNARNG